MPSPEKFRRTLETFEVDKEVRDQINTGYEELADKSDKKLKAAYFMRAMDILDEKIEDEVKVNLMDENGCCKGGSREKTSKQFAKDNKDKILLMQ